MNDFSAVVACVCIFVVAFVIGTATGISHKHNIMWRDAVTRGHAEYCPKDDTFAWKGECK